MLLYPAIDLMDGQVVRLERGLAAKKTIYGTDPVAMAKKWEAAGADWIHLVDLDAAFEGKTSMSSAPSPRPFPFPANLEEECAMLGPSVQV